MDYMYYVTIRSIGYFAYMLADFLTSEEQFPSFELADSMLQFDASNATRGERRMDKTYGETTAGGSMSYTTTLSYETSAGAADDIEGKIEDFIQKMYSNYNDRYRSKMIGSTAWQGLNPDERETAQKRLKAAMKWRWTDIVEEQRARDPSINAHFTFIKTMSTVVGIPFEHRNSDGETVPADRPDKFFDDIVQDILEDITS